jgi:UDP-N-acetylmuramate--alanine ligase
MIGIGGAGMSGIAEVLHKGGHIVTGSDLKESPYTRRLRAAGITGGDLYCYPVHKPRTS